MFENLNEACSAIASILATKVGMLQYDVKLKEVILTMENKCHERMKRLDLSPHELEYWKGYLDAIMEVYNKVNKFEMMAEFKKDDTDS